MNTKQKIRVAGGLIALLGAGCDKDLKTVEASCEIAPGIEAKVVNHQIVGEDYPTLEIRSTKTDNLLVDVKVEYWQGSLPPVYCTDGQRITWGKDVYGNLKTKKGKPANY